MLKELILLYRDIETLCLPCNDHVENGVNEQHAKHPGHVEVVHGGNILGKVVEVESLLAKFQARDDFYT